jgi:hypothetical protein
MPGYDEQVLGMISAKSPSGVWDQSASPPVLGSEQLDGFWARSWAFSKGNETLASEGGSSHIIVSVMSESECRGLSSRALKSWLWLANY